MSDTAKGGELLRLEKTADAMACAFSIVLYGYDQVKMEAAVNAAFDEVRRIDEMLSVYRPASEWSEINRSATQKAVEVSREVFDLLSACLNYSRQSEGAFDISVGPLVKAWGFFRGMGRLPGQAELAAALSNVGYRHISLDPATQTVRFDHSGMEINPGGIGKGYAVDHMVEILRQRGFSTALVTASGSSIYGMGTPPSEPRGWGIDIPDPKQPRGTAAEAFLKDMSISTSGCYEKTLWAGGRLYSHIIDPRTGQPAHGMSLVSVIAPRAVDGEAWTKSFFINGRLWAAKHKPKALSAFFCEDEPEAAYTWLDESA
jgi:thiamine biosynthesis lipoprotein